MSEARPETVTSTREVTYFLATREHGLPMCLAIAERLGIPRGQRVLIAADTSTTAEAEPSFPPEQRTAYADQFARVIDWNQLIWPARAQGWECEPGSPEARLMAAALNPDHAQSIRLVVESIQVPPAKTLVHVFPDAELQLYSDGLMTYGGRRLPLDLSSRVTTLHYRDLIPPLSPRLIDHRNDVDYQPYPFDEVERQVRRPAPDSPTVTGRTGVIVLQYLAGLGLISEAQDRSLVHRMIEAAVAEGCQTIVVKGHPAHPDTVDAIVAESTAPGVVAFDSDAPLESWLIALSAEQRADVSVYSCFSTALPSARALGVRAVAVGTDFLLPKLPRTNGNYVPLVICDSICPTVDFEGPVEVRPPRTNTEPGGALDITLAALAFAASPAAHWHCRAQLAAELRHQSSSARAHVGRYLRSSVQKDLGLTSAKAPSTEPLPVSPPVPDEPDTGIALSVIVPAHNADRFAYTLRRSLVTNAADDIEWLLINDGSTDATAAILAAIADEVANVTVITHPTAQGPSAARNAGIVQARGRYLAFMDADDWLSAGYLHRVRDEALTHGVDLLRFSYVTVTGKEATVVHQPTRQVDVPMSARDHLLPIDQTTLVDRPQPWLGVCRRAFVLANDLLFDPELHTAEDREWTWRLFLAADQVVVSSTIGYYWRRGISDSLTAVGDARQLQFLDAYAKLARTLHGPGQEEYLLKVQRSALMIGAMHLSRSARLDPKLARELVQRLRLLIRSMSEADYRLATVSLQPERGKLLRLLTQRRVSTRKVLQAAREQLIKQA